MDEIGRMEEDDERKDDEVIMKVFLERERERKREGCDRVCMTEVRWDCREE